MRIILLYIKLYFEQLLETVNLSGIQITTYTYAFPFINMCIYVKICMYTNRNYRKIVRDNESDCEYIPITIVCIVCIVYRINMYVYIISNFIFIYYMLMDHR